MKVRINGFFNTKWLAIAVIFTGSVMFLTHLPQEAIPALLQVSDFDKLEHALAYGAITLFFILSVRTLFTLLSVSFVFFTVLAIGTADELTQTFVNRTASLTDLLANIAAIVLILLFCIVLKVRAQSIPNSQHTIPED